MTSIDLDELDDEHEQQHDFRRSNGAPLVSDPDDPAKTLRYSRPSSYADCLDDEFALTEWRIWKAMDGVARSPALQTQIAATKDDDRVSKKELRERALDKGSANERADQGTGLHAMTVRAEDPTDVDFNPPPQFVADLDAYRDMLATYGLVSEMFEVPFVNDRYRAAGTADRVWRTTMPLITPDETRIEPGELFIGDLKTGAKLDFSLPGFCVQTALYATGRLYDVVAERRLATPPLNQRWTMIAHLPVGEAKCSLLWSSIETGLKGAQLAAEIRDWRRFWKNGTFDAPAVTEPKDPVTELIRAFDPEVAEVPIAEMVAYCQTRINTIGQIPSAKRALILNWPDGLPTPKKGISDPADVVLLLNLLDQVEAKFSIPFHPDPRLEKMKGVNKREINRSNEFMLTDE